MTNNITLHLPSALGPVATSAAQARLSEGAGCTYPVHSNSVATTAPREIGRD